MKHAIYQEADWGTAQTQDRNHQVSFTRTRNTITHTSNCRDDTNVCTGPRRSTRLSPKKRKLLQDREHIASMTSIRDGDRSRDAVHTELEARFSYELAGYSDEADQSESVGWDENEHSQSDISPESSFTGSDADGSASSDGHSEDHSITREEDESLSTSSQSSDSSLSTSRSWEEHGHPRPASPYESSSAEGDTSSGADSIHTHDNIHSRKEVDSPISSSASDAPHLDTNTGPDVSSADDRMFASSSDSEGPPSTRVLRSRSQSRQGSHSTSHRKRDGQRALRGTDYRSHCCKAPLPHPTSTLSPFTSLIPPSQPPLQSQHQNRHRVTV
jgi:hypothetical protein